MAARPRSAIIVGGGIAGLFAGLLLAREGSHDIHLIERDARVGGLFRSTRYPGGPTYDMGIHYAIETGTAEVDSVLFDELVEDEWHIFSDSLPEAHVFGGRLNIESGCIDARALPDDLYTRGLVELLDCRDAPTDVRTLAEELETEYGPTFTEHIFRPVMRKLTGCELEALAPGAQHRFHIPRLIALSSDAAKRLKRLPEFDRRIAYTRISDGRSAIRKFYPRHGGIGGWPERMANRLVAAGTRISTGVRVDGVTTDGGRATSVVLSNGEILSCDLLIWTVPLVFLARALGARIAQTRPTFRHVLLLHYFFEKGVIPDIHWVSIYDENRAVYRATLYDNIAPADFLDGSRVTVEVLRSASGGDVEETNRQVRGELADLGLVEDVPSGRLMGHEWLPNALPLKLAENDSDTPSPDPLNGLANVIAVGSATGGTFSQTAVLESVMAEIGRHVGN